MELEQTLDQVSHKYPVFPMALSVVDEQLKQELKKLTTENPMKDKNFLEKLESIGEVKTAADAINNLSINLENSKKEINQLAGDFTTSISNMNINFNYFVNDSIVTTPTINPISINPTGNLSSIDSYDAVKSKSLSTNFEEDYMTTPTPEDTKPEIIEVIEAKEMMEKMQYAFLLGTTTTTYTHEELRKMNLWIMTHPAEFLLNQRDALTKDVNYNGH